MAFLLQKIGVGRRYILHISFVNGCCGLACGGENNFPFFSLSSHDGSAGLGWIDGFMMAAIYLL